MRKLQITAAAAVLLLVTPHFVTADESNSDTYRQLKLFSDVFERVRSDYVEDRTDKELIEFAIQGMLSALEDRKSVV
jgi:carboxyl-terminal processing protease